MSSFTQEKTKFLAQLVDDNFQFETTLAFIEKHYNFTPSAFNNGDVINTVDQNQGSCKIFSLVQLIDLNKEQALACFGQHYRDVIATPDTNNHHNLRRVLKEGIENITFTRFPLEQKES